MPGSSLQEFDRVADRIRLHQQGDPRPILLVEGGADTRFVTRLFGRRSISVFEGGTRSAVIDASREIHSWGLTGIACIVDRDLDDVVAIHEKSVACLVPYDDADLEGMLWNTESLESLLEELASNAKLVEFGGPDALRSQADSVLAPLTRLRAANAQNGWGLNFTELRLDRKINRTTLSLNVRSLCDALHRDDVDVCLADLVAVAENPSWSKHCPNTGRKLVRGKDALAVASVALRRLIGSRSLNEVTVDGLADRLRLAASPADTAGTHWRASITQLLGI